MGRHKNTPQMHLRFFSTDLALGIIYRNTEYFIVFKVNIPPTRRDSLKTEEFIYSTGKSHHTPSPLNFLSYMSVY